MYKLITELLPVGVGCSKETRDLLVDCCNEFVHLISSESNEICEKSGRKTIAPDHVLEALRSLGFGDYVTEVQQSFEEHTEQSKEKERIRASSRAEASKLSEEELLRQQEELFSQARLKYQQQQAAGSQQPTSQATEPVSPAESPSKAKKGDSSESLDLSE